MLYLFIFIGYLSGSISGSLLLGKFKNIDIRKMGSGNAGGTNALRSVGPIFALGTILIDVLKGYFPIIVCSVYIDHNVQWAQILIGFAAILGHVYPIFYNFKGGKGAGTMVGVVLALFPYSIPFVFFVWILILIITGFVGLSTMCAGITLMIITYFKFPETIMSPFGYFSIIIALFLIYSHRENIIRMLRGTENRFNKIMLFKKNN